MRTRKGGFLRRMLSNMTKRIINRKRIQPEMAPNYGSRTVTSPRTVTRNATRPRTGTSTRNATRPSTGTSRNATRPRSGSRSRTSPSPNVAAVIREINEIHNAQNDANTTLEELTRSNALAVKANAIAAKANADALEKKALTIINRIQSKKNISEIEYERATAKMNELRTQAERNALNEQEKAEALLRKYDSRGGKNSKKN
jgi:hypothetical protein